MRRVLVTEPRLDKQMPDSTATRLAKYLREHPDASTLSMSDLAKAIGCSRQYVRQNPAPVATAADTGATSRTVVRANPRSLRPERAGGMTLAQIGAAVALHPHTVGKLWKSLGLPARAAPAMSPREKAHRSYERRKNRHKEVTAEGDGETRSAHAKFAGRCNSAGVIACCASCDVWRAARHFHGRTPTSSAGEPAGRGPSAQLRAGCASTV